DTVNVSIIDTTQLVNNQKAFVWLYESATKSDTHYVSIQNDTVTIFYDVDDTVPFAKYIFPLKVGNKWIRSLTTDSIVVVSKDTISVPAGVFEPAFLIEEEWYQLNAGVHILTWLVPKVGIVKQKRFIFGWGPIEKTKWELIDYFIKP
nr:hypothetical protein [Fodinibius sp.]NIV12778.1 hypothetical protein [Fodinibius sp.]NIY26503.1 hypothetical protein [Fodinibius sp.]